METAKEELKKEITEIIIYFNPWLEKNPQWVKKRETDLNNALNKYDIKRKTLLTEESAKNIREWFDMEVENIREYAKLPSVVKHYCFGFEAAMKKAKQKLINHRII